MGFKEYNRDTNTNMDVNQFNSPSFKLVLSRCWTIRLDLIWAKLFNPNLLTCQLRVAVNESRISFLN